MLKKIGISLGLLVVVMAGGVFYLSQNAPKIVQGIIEEQASIVTQVPVKLKKVELSLTDLKAGLQGLTVGNPAGFATDKAISLGEVSVKIAKNWTRDLIVINEVMIRAPEITYEIGSNGSNISAIQNNIETFMNKNGGASKSVKSSEPAPASQGSKDAGPKLVINHLYIKGGKVNVSASIMKGKTMTTNLPDIHLKDIGKKSGGASPAEIVDQIMTSITKYSGVAAGSVDLSALGLANISGKSADALKNVGKDVGNKAKDAMKGAGGALKNLFGK